mgnify:FL=1
MEISPNYMLGQMSLSWAYLLGGDFDNGIKILKRVTKQVEDDPFVTKLLFQLAAAQYCNGEHADALDTMERIVAIKPRNPPYHRLRALCFEALGDEAGAARALEMARTVRADQLEHCVLPPLPGQFEDLHGKICPERQNGTHVPRGTVVDLSPREAS